MVRQHEGLRALLHEDIKIRKFVREKLKAAGISKIIIERPLKKCRVTVHTAKPGVVIGKKGADIEKLRKELARMAPGAEVHLNLVEVRKPETDSNSSPKAWLNSSSAALRSAAP